MDIKKSMPIIIKCFGNAVEKNLQDILEKFGLGPALIGVGYQVIKDSVTEFIECREEEESLHCGYKIEDVKCYSSKNPFPDRMDFVIFCGKENQLLTEAHKERIKIILQKRYIGDDECVAIIDDFICDYMGGSVEIESEDDCVITDNAIIFYFFEYEDHMFNKERMNLVMQALNGLLEEEIFDAYIVGGHDKNE